MRASPRDVVAGPFAMRTRRVSAWAGVLAAGSILGGPFATGLGAPAWLSPPARATIVAQLDPGTTELGVGLRAIAAAKRASALADSHAKSTNAAAGVAPAPAPAKAATTTTTTRPAANSTSGVPAKSGAMPPATPTMKSKPAGAAPVVPAPSKSVKPATGSQSPAPAHRPGALASKSAAPTPTTAPRSSTPGTPSGTPAVAVSMRPQLTVAPAPQMNHLDDHATYVYDALGRRDPFQPLVGGLEYVDSDAPPDVGGIKVVGIVWGADDKFAMVEDARGNSMVLRRGDKVMNGFVEGLRRDAVLINLTVDGQSQSVTIPLTRKGDSNGR